MLTLSAKYQVRFAESASDVQKAQRLRWLCFIGQRGLYRPDGCGPDGCGPDGIDADDFDGRCQHVMVEERRSGRLVCCFRFMFFPTGREILQSYSAQFYDLSALSRRRGAMVEMGRFCIHPAVRDPNIVRLAWAEMSRFVDQNGVQMLFGCSSFMGADPEAHSEALAMLRARHLAPRRWLPRVKAPDVFRFARALARRTPDPRAAMRAMPPLLRSYLLMGGWVSDHAVLDRQLNTLHVFTGLDIRALSHARRARLQGRTVA